MVIFMCLRIYHRALGCLTFCLSLWHNASCACWKLKMWPLHESAGCTKQVWPVLVHITSRQRNRRIVATV